MKELTEEQKRLLDEITRVTERSHATGFLFFAYYGDDYIYRARGMIQDIMLEAMEAACKSIRKHSTIIEVIG
jgi:hypothetical protein